MRLKYGFFKCTYLYIRDSSVRVNMKGLDEIINSYFIRNRGTFKRPFDKIVLETNVNGGFRI